LNNGDSINKNKKLTYAVYVVAKDERYNSRVIIVSNPNTNNAFKKSLQDENQS